MKNKIKILLLTAALFFKKLILELKKVNLYFQSILALFQTILLLVLIMNLFYSWQISIRYELLTIRLVFVKETLSRGEKTHAASGAMRLESYNATSRQHNKLNKPQAA